MDNLEKPPDGDEINLIDYFRVIYKYRRMILCICLIAIATTAIISLSKPNIYSATASIVPPMDIIQKEAGGALGARRSSMLANIMGVMNIAGIYIHFLESRIVTDAIIDRFDLLKVYNVKERFMAHEILKGNTSTEATNQGIFYITVKDKDPCMAAAMANAYVEELDRLNKRLSSGQATNKREFIEKRLKEIDGQLSDIVNIPKKKAEVLETLYGTLVVEYELARIEEAKSMPTIQILDKAVVPEVKCKPRRRQMVMLSAIAALFLAVFAAFAREYFAKANNVQVLDRAIVPEQGMARGTTKKVMLAGAVSLMVAGLLAFVRKSFAKVHNVTRGQRRHPYKARQQGGQGGAFGKREIRRKIVAAQRKRVHKSYSEELAEGIEEHMQMDLCAISEDQ